MRISTLALCGLALIQSVVAAPQSAPRATTDSNALSASELTFAPGGSLDNVGTSGDYASSALPSVVIASRSTENPDFTSSASPSTTAVSACTPGQSVAVTFNEFATTNWGEKVYLVGSISQLGNWDPRRGVLLNAGKYTASNPLWYITVNLPGGTSFQYKFVRIKGDGWIVWEGDSDRSYTVPSCGVAEVNTNWR
ncbi:starch binding domain-containing protein [Aspergillus floccosus]